MKKILLIQTAFLGDVVLITPLISELKRLYPKAQLDVLVRKGNEGILANNPSVNSVLTWDKKSGKYRQLAKLLRQIRNEKYDEVIGVQRFISNGVLIGLSKAASRVGFSRNPLSFLFTRKVKHTFGDGTHEVERNLSLLSHHNGAQTMLRPNIFPSEVDYNSVKQYQQAPYYCIAPASVWFTKQVPVSKWVELIRLLDASSPIYLLGSPTDSIYCELIQGQCTSYHVENLAGKLSLLQSAALMQHAKRNYVNDSGPLHIASAVNAPVTAFFCSTVPRFGFGPLSETSQVIETHEILACRPCGIHGHKVCPEGHFRCALQLNMSEAAN